MPVTHLPRVAVVPSIRPDLMRRLLLSWPQHLTHWPAVVLAQGYTPAERAEISRNPQVHDLVDMGEAPRAMYPLRVHAAERWPAGVYCQIDDDMLLLPETNWDGAVDLLEDPSIGIVTCAWARHRNVLPRHMAVYQRGGVRPQMMVNTGGGMVCRADVLHHALAGTHVPLRAYVFNDPAISLVSYCAGYRNVRYLRSLALHLTVEHRGRGLRRLYRERGDTLWPLPRELITMRPTTHQTYEAVVANHHIADSRDLTPLAHSLHEQNRKG